MELLVFGHAGARVLVFPTRQGRFFDYENWGLVEALRASIDGGNLQLFCVDSVDSESLYCRSCSPRARIERLRRYEAYILDEVLPFSATRNPQPFLIAHGCSIGAYHAVTLATRHPGCFGKVVGLSGRYDLTLPVDGFSDLFDGYYDEDIYFFTPTHFLAGLSQQNALESLRRLEIQLAVGSQDPFRESNALLSQTLESKGVPHQLHIWSGKAHKASAWRQMVRHYL